MAEVEAAAVTRWRNS
jgi:hypothetical protein